ncbi:MAG: peptidyl-prolyl cis-trans isomerase, partial [Thiotrichaceae bacterium]|nr:peptidyl-prolyl cis-trans isomerase [Thiotrichaceae bacterium]
MIKFTTNFGDIIIEVNHEKAPISAKNFEQYVRDGFYDGLIFHRVISNFMIQGGGFLPDMVEKETRESIQNEADNGLPNANGTLAMARTTAPHSASSQFFINVADNRFLDFPGQDGWGYCVFGRVIEGMDIVEKIKAVATTTRMGHGDVPVDDVMIEKAEVM